MDMQSTLCHFQFPWKIQETHLFLQKPISKSPRNPLFLTNALDDLDKVLSPPVVASLPVVIRRSGKVSRYVWDGELIRLVGVDDGDSKFSIDSGDGFRKLFGACSLGVWNFFVPKQVRENYMEYVKWKFLHRVFSSALQVLATQAMFRAIGIGYSRSLPSAAALNWVLKDGLGRLSRCIYTASLASAFDTNLKFLQLLALYIGVWTKRNQRVRFSTSVIFSLSIGVELLTPSFPQYFLLLASIANIAKQISLACYLATSSAVHRSFAIADNLGEVSAKAQIQSVCFDNLGLMLAALLNILFKNSQRLQAGLPFVVYPIFSAIDLFGIYQGLKHVHLQTLTKDRLEIILSTWIESRYVPSPAEVSKEEGIDFLWTQGEKLWPIRIGCLDPKSQVPKLSMISMKSISQDDHYFIGMEVCKGLKRSKRLGILLCLHEGAVTADIIMSLLQANFIRNALLSSHSRWDNIVDDNANSDFILKEWIKLIEESKRCTQDELQLLDEQMSAQGWAVKNVLLSTQEQVRYNFVNDQRF